MGVHRAGLQRLGHEARMPLFEAVRAGAALQKRRHVHALRHGQAARSLRPVQALVAGEAHDVGVERAHVQRQRARRLRGVEHEQRAGLVREARHAGHVVHVAREVRRVGGRHEVSALFQQAPVGGEVEGAVRADGGHVHRASALVAGLVQRPQHRVVRGGGRHGAPASGQKPRDGDVERHGGVGRERHAGRRGRAQKPRHLVARVEHGHAGVDGRLVHAAPHAAERADGARHGLGHLGRLAPGRGRVVEVDHGRSLPFIVRIIPVSRSAAALTARPIRNRQLTALPQPHLRAPALFPADRPDTAAGTPAPRPARLTTSR